MILPLLVWIGGYIWLCTQNPELAVAIGLLLVAIYGENNTTGE